MTKSQFPFFWLLMSVLCTLSLAEQARGQDKAPSQRQTIVVYGGGGAAYMDQFADEFGVNLRELTDDDILADRQDAAKGNVLVLLGGGGRGGGQYFATGDDGDVGPGRGRGWRGSQSNDSPSGGVAPRGGGTGFSGRRGAAVDPETAKKADEFLQAVLRDQPNLRIIATPQQLAGMQRRGSPLLFSPRIEEDEAISAYVGGRQTSRENLRRLLGYLAITYAGASGQVEHPAEVKTTGFYHPDLDDFEPDLDRFVEWSRKQGIDVAKAPRVVILANYTHFVARNQLAVDAILRELTKRGALAACVIVEDAESRELLKRFGPQVAIDAFHRGDDVTARIELGIPHLYAMWVTRQTVNEWKDSVSHVGSFLGVESSEVSGSIEPHVVSARSEEGDVERFVPIPDRIDRIVSRALSWARLATKPNREKHIAMLVSSAPAGDLRTFESLSRVLERMESEGYLVEGETGAESLRRGIEQYVEQFTPLEADKIDALARSGHAALVPLDDYRRWLSEKVPEEQRKQLVERWGEAPGKIMTWTNDDREQFLVIPKFDVGNVALVAKPTPSSDDYVKNFDKHKHDQGNPPSHNILATYFWLEEGYRADAIMVWGALSFDLLLPGKSIGQSGSDWTDIILGAMPNVRPYGLGSLSFAIPAKRKAKAVLIDYLPPPRVAGEMDDELLNLQSDLVKWARVEQPGLRERFLQAIVERVRSLNLDKDMHWELDANGTITDEQINSLALYLNEIEAERIAVDRHTLGENPRDELEIPYLVTCLGRPFLNELAAAFPVEGSSMLPGDLTKFVRGKAEEAIKLVVRDGFSTEEAIMSVGGDASVISAESSEGFDLAVELHEAFQQCSLEIDRIIDMFAGRFVPPGPSSPPERNPSAVPTGRNMYVMNPAEIPTKPSWELGTRLVDDLLEQQLKSRGDYPRKIAYSIHTRGTMSDFGVTESQILYTLGVRPVWGRGGQVTDVEVIPAVELGRPRIDVFIEPKHYYTEYLESRVRLIDKAVRLVANLDEPDNYVFANRERTKRELLSDGVAEEEAAALSLARIFTTAPERFGSGLHDKLFESTGIWDTEDQLTDVYIEQHNYAYTESYWARPSSAAFRRQLAGADIVVRSLNRGGALESRAHYSGGMLALVAKTVTGTEPAYFLNDLRYGGEERVLSARDAVRRDLRAKLLNDKWIAAQMKEGRGGAFQINNLVWHAVAFRINSPQSVSDDVWEQIVDVYLKDRRQLNVREWMENSHPRAFQKLNELLLEAVRKGYWQPNEELLQEIAAGYAQSVARDGLKASDVNQKLDAFVRKALDAMSEPAPAELLAAYDARLKPAKTKPAPTAVQERAPERITGNQLVESPEIQATSVAQSNRGMLLAGLAAIALLVSGYVLHQRAPARGRP